MSKSSPLPLDQHAFMTTFTGQRVDPTNVTVDDVSIVDIAHALSQLCRFTGHTKEFYSVAQHSVLVAANVALPFGLEGLLHDAAEAYVNDLSRPLKHHPSMGAYVFAEMRAERAIRERFKLPLTMSPEVKHVDNLLVVDEARDFMADSTWTKGHARLFTSMHHIIPWSSKEAEATFLKSFEFLVSQR
jgi:5'-deoxynucleotidase YfbR-like HD superfamily hydrolase